MSFFFVCLYFFLKLFVFLNLKTLFFSLPFKKTTLMSYFLTILN